MVVSFRRHRLAACLAAALAILGAAAVPAHAQDSAAPATEALPEVDLTGRLLFQIMAAEVAAQRGELGAAFKTYMSVASETRDPRLARRAAEIALGARASNEALEAIVLWRQLAPQSREATEALATVYLSRGRYDEAQPLVAELLAQSDRPADVLARTQRAMARAANPEQGFAMLERLAQPYLKNADVRLVLAAGAQAAGLSARATAEARAALELAPDSPRAVLAAAQALLGTDPKAAAALLAQFLTRHPAAADVRLAYARVLLASGDTAAARKQFAQLVQDSPRNPDLLYSLGVLSAQARLSADARDYFTRYLALLETSDGAVRDPDSVYLYLAQLAEQEKKYDEALGWLAKVDDGENALRARLREAQVMARQGKLEQARGHLQKVQASSDEERTQLVIAEAQLLREAKRNQEALALLEKALAASPNDPELIYDTAMAAERLDQVERMETLLRQLIAAKPDHAHAYNALGYSLADRNLRLAEAKTLIEKALQLTPGDPFITDSLGWVEFRLGNREEALRLLRQAYKSRPDAEIGAHLGEVLWAMGQRDEARRVWAEASSRDAANDVLRETLVRLKVQ
jgi:tetratricopeptide (TPR) repeat protein